MNDFRYVTRRYSSYNHLYTSLTPSVRLVLTNHGVHEFCLFGLVEDAIVLIIDVEVQNVVVHNVINELTFFLWITSLLTRVDDRSRRFLLLHHPAGLTSFCSWMVLSWTVSYNKSDMRPLLALTLDTRPKDLCSSASLWTAASVGGLEDDLALVTVEWDLGGYSLYSL